MEHSIPEKTVKIYPMFCESRLEMVEISVTVSGDRGETTIECPCGQESFVFAWRMVVKSARQTKDQK